MPLVESRPGTDDDTPLLTLSASPVPGAGEVTAGTGGGVSDDDTKITCLLDTAAELMPVDDDEPPSCCSEAPPPPPLPLALPWELELPLSADPGTGGGPDPEKPAAIWAAELRPGVDQDDDGPVLYMLCGCCAHGCSRRSAGGASQRAWRRYHGDLLHAHSQGEGSGSRCHSCSYKPAHLRVGEDQEPRAGTGRRRQLGRDGSYVVSTQKNFRVSKLHELF